MIEYEIPFVCLIFTSLIAIIFFTKKKVDLEENNYYRNILLSTLLVNTTNFVSHYLASIYARDGITPWFANIFSNINKLGSLFIIIITINLLSYILYISFEKFKKSASKTKFVSIISYVILGIIIFLLNFEVYKVGDVTSGHGSAVIFSFAIALINLIVTFIIAICNVKKFDKRYYAIYFIIPLIFLLGIFVLFHPEFNIYDLILSLLCYLMYFTIENPDVKMLSKIELAKTQAEKANAAKTDFLSSMSHEIRTPLNAIVGFSESITEAETLEEAKENAKDILTASQNLLEIVNGILDISKIEANKMEIVNTEYNLKEEVEKLVKLIKPRIGEKPIEFKYYIAPDIPGKLYGDKGKIKEIMTNILTNAVKYTKEGYIELKVSCINKDNESSLVISVEDTGRGIKPENIDKLFTKFERLNEDRNTTIEGAGLGLAITKKLVEMMGGKIIVQSVYGSGSNFTVYLKQRIITRTSVSFDTSNHDGELNLIGKRVLVVDDNVLNIKVAEKLLKKYSINVDSCETGYECIEKIKQGKHYDLILMDDMMPKMTGTETLHILQEKPSFKDKTVVLTANAIEGMKEKYIEEGFDDYLAKPIEKYELERVLRKYLNKEKEHIEFEPIPDSFYDISDTIVEKLNAEEIIKSDQKNKTQ